MLKTICSGDSLATLTGNGFVQMITNCTKQELQLSYFQVLREKLPPLGDHVHLLVLFLVQVVAQVFPTFRAGSCSAHTTPEERG